MKRRTFTAGQTGKLVNAGKYNQCVARILQVHSKSLEVELIYAGNHKVTVKPAQFEPAFKAGPSNEGGAWSARLQVGDVVKHSGKEYIVWAVSDCRAAIVPVVDEAVGFKDSRTGDAVAFAKQGRSISISPNSECEILHRLGEGGIVRFLEQRKTERQNMSKEAAAKKSKKSTEPKLGRLGGFLGNPITAVIRAMGKLGWEYWEARHVFTSEKVAVADNTIRIQLSAGRNGDGEPAPVKAELAKLRPDAKLKPARKSAEGKKAKGGKGKGKAAAKSSAKKSAAKKASKPAAEEEDAGQLDSPE